MGSDKPVLEVIDLVAGYNQHEVLNKITLTVPRGSWFTLLGPNGSGKSTFLRIVAGQPPERRGDVFICGHSMNGDQVAALRHLGFACQPEKLPGLLTGKQCLEVYAAAKELDRVDDEILALAYSLKIVQYMDKYVDTYSLGTRQKLCILLALIGNPSLIVLDEVFNGLDPASALVLKTHLRARVTARQSSVLLATHALDIVEHYSDTAGLLLNGRIMQTWDQTALIAIRRGQASSFELQLAAATDGTMFV